MIKLQKKQIIIISICILLILCLALVSFLTTQRKAQTEVVIVPPTPISTLTPAPSQTINTFTRDPNFEKFALKDAVPSTNKLTIQEESYPTGLPQQFPPPQSIATGTLVVTADTDNVRIVITTKDPGDANLTLPHQYQSPANSAPVRIVLPTNYYTLIAEKDKYVWKWIPIMIEKNKVTRLNIHLDPANLQ